MLSCSSVSTGTDAEAFAADDVNDDHEDAEGNDTGDDGTPEKDEARPATC
jgi:hypothetical protein